MPKTPLRPPPPLSKGEGVLFKSPSLPFLYTHTPTSGEDFTPLVTELRVQKDYKDHKLTPIQGGKRGGVDLLRVIKANPPPLLSVAVEERGETRIEKGAQAIQRAWGGNSVAA